MAPTSAQTGLGCAVLFPASLIGFAGLTDGIGPTGWRGLSELLGWFYLCLVGSWLLALLLARGSHRSVQGYVLALATALVIGVLSYKAISWLGLDAPMSAKMRFTFSMQVVGSLGTGFGVLWISYTTWVANRRS